MPERKNDATKHLASDAKTQVTRKGLKIGVPSRAEVFAALKRAAKPTKG